MQGRFEIIKGAGIRAVRIYDENNNPVEADPISDSLQMIDVLHARTHEGVVYSATTFFPGVAAAASVDMLLQVPSDQSAHFRPSLVAGADAQLMIFEGTTFSVVGTSVTPRNRNRFAGDNSKVTLSSTPTITDPGVELFDLFIPGGAFLFTPGNSGSFEEVILKTGTNYLVRATNLSGAATDLETRLTWYEPPFP